MGSGDALGRAQEKDVAFDRFQRACRPHDGNPSGREDRRRGGRNRHVDSRMDHADHLGRQRRSAQEFRFDALAHGNDSPPPLPAEANADLRRKISVNAQHVRPREPPRQPDSEPIHAPRLNMDQIRRTPGQVADDRLANDSPPDRKVQPRINGDGETFAPARGNAVGVRRDDRGLDLVGSQALGQPQHVAGRSADFETARDQQHLQPRLRHAIRLGRSGLSTQALRPPEDLVDEDGRPHSGRIAQERCDRQAGLRRRLERILVSSSLRVVIFPRCSRTARSTALPSSALARCDNRDDSRYWFR